MASRQLEKKLDLIFSKYIRLRDSSNGVFYCCSCGALKPEQQMDAGHFISRKWRNTRWREDNVHGQCRADNRFGNGEAAGYAMFMIKKYGLEHVEMLHQLSRKTAKFTDAQLEEMISEFKVKVKELQNSKGNDKVKVC